MDLDILNKIREAKAEKAIRTGISELSPLELEAIAPLPLQVPRAINPVIDGTKVCKGYSGPCPVAGNNPQPVENFAFTGGPSLNGYRARRSICKVCHSIKKREYKKTETYRVWFEEWKKRPGVAARRAEIQRSLRRRKKTQLKGEVES